jgi:ribosomal protein L37E
MDKVKGKIVSKLKDGDQDWETECSNCGQKPTVHPTGLCGPCCFGEAETIGGNW